jgi:hypothetical protein
MGGLLPSELACKGRPCLIGSILANFLGPTEGLRCETDHGLFRQTGCCQDMAHGPIW